MPRSLRMTLRLLLLLLLLGCDVSRDLRQELFACDAGGFCDQQRVDSGVQQVLCPTGNTCICQEGRECSYRCTGGCSIQCEVGSTCALDCNLADCSTICATGATCNIRCNTGTCDTICNSGSDCSIECPITSQCTCTGPSCPF